METPAERHSPTIFDILRTRVRAASDGKLAIAASLGVVGLITLGVLRTWPWAAVALCGVLLGAGTWGILDRSRAAESSLARRVPRVLMDGLRISAGFVALSSLLVLFLGALGLCLGTWIS